LGDDIIQILNGLRGEGLQTEVIQEQQIDRQEFGQETSVSPSGSGGVQVGQQALGAPREDPQVSFQGFDGQGVGEMTFADAGGAGQQQIFVAIDEGTTGQVLDEGPVHAGSGGKVKAGQGFVLITTGQFEPAGQALLAAALQFVIEQQGQEFGRTELAFGGLGRPGVEGQHHPAQFE